MCMLESMVVHHIRLVAFYKTRVFSGHSVEAVFLPCFIVKFMFGTNHYTKTALPRQHTGFLSLLIAISLPLFFLARCRVPSTVPQTSVAYFTRRAVKPKGYYAAVNASSSEDLFDSDDGDRASTSLRGADVYTVDRIVAERK